MSGEKVKILVDKCVGCGLCVGACPFGCIEMKDKGSSSVNIAGGRGNRHRETRHSASKTMAWKNVEHNKK